MVNNENLKKKDLELILEVNKKAVEIETGVAEQNEEIIDSLVKLQDYQKEHERKLNEIVDNAKTTNKDLFRIQVLFVTGLLALVAQIIQIFLKK